MQPHDWCLIDSLLSNATRLHMCVLLVYHTQRQKGIFPSQYIPRLFRKEFKYLHLSTFTHLSSSYFYRLYWGNCWKSPDALRAVPAALLGDLSSPLTSLLRAWHAIRHHWRREKGNVRLDGDYCLLFFLHSQASIWGGNTVGSGHRPPPSMSLETNYTLLWPQVPWVLWFN